MALNLGLTHPAKHWEKRGPFHSHVCFVKNLLYHALPAVVTSGEMTPQSGTALSGFPETSSFFINPFRFIDGPVKKLKIYPSPK